MTRIADQLMNQAFVNKVAGSMKGVDEKSELFKKFVNLSAAMSDFSNALTKHIASEKKKGSKRYGGMALY